MKAVDDLGLHLWFHCDKCIYLYLNSNDGRVIMIRVEGGPNRVGEDVTCHDSCNANASIEDLRFR